MPIATSITNNTNCFITTQSDSTASSPSSGQKKGLVELLPPNNNLAVFRWWETIDIESPVTIIPGELKEFARAVRD